MDIAAKIERTLASDQVVDLSQNLDQYLVEYADRYSVAPRRSDNPLEIAEAYLAHSPSRVRFREFFRPRIIYDRNGVRLAEVFEEGQRTWVPLG